MFNKNLLDTINSKILDFENISLTLGNFSFSRTDYDRINTLMLFNSIADERKDNLVIFNPHGTIFTLYSLVMLSFAELQRDLTDKKNAIENNLNIGDRVKLDGCLGVYKGRGIHSGRSYLKIRCGGKYDDLVYVFIPEDLHRIQKYSGGATRLRGHKKRNEIKPREALSEILKLDIGELNIVRNSRIAIITEKKNIVDYLRLLKINGYNFIDMFPTARLINPEKYANIPGVRLRGEPVVFIISSFANLLDFVQKGNKINTVIIDGATKIKNNYGNINALKDERKIGNILIFLNHRNLEEKNGLENMDFKTWVWTKSDIVELKDLGGWKFPQDDPLNPFSPHYVILKSLARQKVNLIEVKLAETESNGYFQGAFEMLKKIKLTNNNSSNSVVSQFLCSAYGLLLYFQHSLFPLKLCLKVSKEQGVRFLDTDEMLKKVSILSEELLMRHVGQDFKKVFERLINCLEKINEQFLSYNFKAYKLIEVLKKAETYKTAIIVRKPWYKEVLTKWLEQNGSDLGKAFFSKSIDIIDFNSFQKAAESSYYDRVIFSGWYGFKNRYVFNTGVAFRVDILLYYFEKPQAAKFLEDLENDSFNLRDTKSRAHILGLDVKDFSKHEVIEKKVKYEDYGDDIDKIVNDISFSLVSDRKNYAPDDESDATEARHIIFEEESHVFFTVNYKAKVLNRIEAKIEEKTVNELNVGDEIIFIGGHKRDIFEELIAIAESSQNISNEVCLSKIWKKAISKYMMIKNKSITAFTQELQKLGCERHSMTVEGWLTNNNIIAPEDVYKTIKTIADLTSDSDLNSNLLEVVHSCKKIRGLHIRLGRYLAQCILASVDTQKESKLEGPMRERIKELSQHIIITQVKAINENMIMVSKNKVNRVLELNE